MISELPPGLLPPPAPKLAKRRLRVPWQYVAVALAFLAGALFGRAF